MARGGDNAPVGQTCPKIDDVISTCKEIYQSSEEMTMGELKSIEQTMEKIRSDNSALRDWGNKMCDELQEMEKDKDYYQDLAETYEKDIANLKSEIKDLEKELSQSE